MNEKTLNSASNQVMELPNEDIILNKINPIKKDDLWQIFLDGVNGFTDDFFCDGREEYTEQIRESF